jgi:hypothetical protein
LEQAIKKGRQVLSSQLDKIRDLHEAFDSEEEYKRNAAKCGIGIERLAMRDG